MGRPPAWNITADNRAGTVDDPAKMITFSFTIVTFPPRFMKDHKTPVTNKISNTKSAKNWTDLTPTNGDLWKRFFCWRVRTSRLILHEKTEEESSLDVYLTGSVFVVRRKFTVAIALELPEIKTLHQVFLNRNSRCLFYFGEGTMLRIFSRKVIVVKCGFLSANGEYGLNYQLTEIL